MQNEAKPYIGGQAVIEGVMMRSPACLAVAVRRPDGAIVVREGPFESRYTGKRWAKLPGIRGMLTLVESLRMGFGALRFSAEQQMTEEERAQEGGSGKGAMALSILFALALFMALPQLLAAGSGKLLGFDLGLSDASYHTLIGGFKLLVFFLYIVAISRLPEIARVFQYHGAEHKTIHAYEQGLDLTVENVRAQTTLHPRCGTTFLVMVVVVSIVLGVLVAPLLLPNAKGFSGQIQLLALRISLLPFVAALSYEIQRFTARYCTRGPLRVLLWPGFLFQKLTTREPNDEQLEIAIAAMQSAEWREQQGGEAPESDELLVFPSFAGFKHALPALREADASQAA